MTELTRKKFVSSYQTQLNTSGDVFQRNADVMRAQAEDLKQKLNMIYQGGNETARDRHRQHGKLLPRERIQLLLDPGSDFLELSAMAGYELYDDNIPAAAIITGIGKIHNIECMLIVNDATVKCGTYYRSELSAMAGYELYDDNIPAAGIITGIGKIHNIECMLIVNDATVKCGTYYRSELSAMAGYELYDDNIPAAGIITGIGKIHNIECMLIVNDATVKGGTYY